MQEITGVLQCLLVRIVDLTMIRRSKLGEGSDSLLSRKIIESSQWRFLMMVGLLTNNFPVGGSCTHGQLCYVNGVGVVFEI